MNKGTETAGNVLALVFILAVIFFSVSNSIEKAERESCHGTDSEVTNSLIQKYHINSDNIRQHCRYAIRMAPAILAAKNKGKSKFVTQKELILPDNASKKDKLYYSEDLKTLDSIFNNDYASASEAVDTEYQRCIVEIIRGLN